MGLRRDDLQSLAQIRLEDAKLLLEQGRVCSAYYLAGYAVELGLKACVSRQIRQDEIPDKELINKVLTHELPRLVRLAGLSGELTDAQDADHQFQANWAVVCEWSPDSRYDIIEMMSAQLLLQAIDDPDHGVLRWIRQHW